MSKKPHSTANGDTRPPLATYLAAAMPYAMLYAQMERAGNMEPGTLFRSDFDGNADGSAALDPLQVPPDIEIGSPEFKAFAFANMAATLDYSQEPEDVLAERFIPLFRQHAEAARLAPNAPRVSLN